MNLYHCILVSGNQQLLQYECGTLLYFLNHASCHDVLGHSTGRLGFQLHFEQTRYLLRHTSTTNYNHDQIKLKMLGNLVHFVKYYNKPDLTALTASSAVVDTGVLGSGWNGSAE